MIRVSIVVSVLKYDRRASSLAARIDRRTLIRARCPFDEEIEHDLLGTITWERSVRVLLARSLVQRLSFQ